jgi:hypothetical protein
MPTTFDSPCEPRPDPWGSTNPTTWDINEKIKIFRWNVQLFSTTKSSDSNFDFFSPPTYCSHFYAMLWLKFEKKKKIPFPSILSFFFLKKKTFSFSRRNRHRCHCSCEPWFCACAPMFGDHLTMDAFCWIDYSCAFPCNQLRVVLIGRRVPNWPHCTDRTLASLLTWIQIFSFFLWICRHRQRLWTRISTFNPIEHPQRHSLFLPSLLLGGGVSFCVSLGLQHLTTQLCDKARCPRNVGLIDGRRRTRRSHRASWSRVENSPTDYDLIRTCHVKSQRPRLVFTTLTQNHIMDAPFFTNCPWARWCISEEFVSNFLVFWNSSS